MGQTCEVFAITRLAKGLLLGRGKALPLQEDSTLVGGTHSSMLYSDKYKRQNPFPIHKKPQENVSYGDGRVICNDTTTRLVTVNGNLTARRYIDYVLRPIMPPFL